MSAGLAARRITAALTLAVVVAGAGGVQAAPAGTETVAAADECPPIASTDDLTRGMTGTALSVTEGTDPTSFDVEILDVLRDAVGPGRDIVIANLSGPVIDATGGLWFGASGSPVYVPDGEGGELLVGAIAYGLAGGGSTLAGITPAADMIGLLDPVAAAEPAALDAVRLPDATVRRAAGRLGLDATEMANTLVPLKTPVSVSGVNARGLAKVKNAIARQNLPFVPYVGSSASAAEAEEPIALAAGDSFAAAISLGDVTLAGVGTTTFVCYGQAVAFGHPFFWTGDSLMAARAADTITIVKDNVWGSYKLANVGANAGVVTGDRLAGIVADLGEGPTTTPVSSHVTDVGSGRERAGTSEAVLSEFLPFLTFLHTLVNVDVTIDRIGPGNAELAYTVTGTRESGEPWTLTRTDHVASPWDVSVEASARITDDVAVLHAFESQGVDITGVDVGAVEVEDDFESYRIRRVLVWNGDRFVKTNVVRARPGRSVLLRAVLAPSHAAAVERVDLLLRVPRYVRNSGYIEVRGGAGGDFFSEEPCLFEHEECGEEGASPSFDTVLAELAARARGDEVVATLRVGRRGYVRATDREAVPAVVHGSRFLAFDLVGAPCCAGGLAP